MNRRGGSALLLLALVGCGSNTTSAPDNELRSDMPARTVGYYVANNAEMREMDAICDTWKASQRPVATWPSVIFQNCNNVDGAKQSLSRRADTDKLLNAGK
jgi:hypothetical protein